MRGEVIYFDDARGIGFLRGEDGNRYHFAGADVSGVVVKGLRVEFAPDGNNARRVQGNAAPATQPQPQPREESPRQSVPPIAVRPRRRSLFGGFLAAVTRDYANFRDRAARAEFWGFMLFSLLGLAVLAGIGLAADEATGALNRERPIITGIVVLVYAGLTLVPSLAVTVRRIHDIGLSGWFILVGLIPSFGNLVILVFALLPSQRQANRWGAPPNG